MNSPITDALISRLKFCGCGDPESILELIHDFILLVNKHKEEKSPSFIGEEWDKYCARHHQERLDFIKDYANEVIWLLFYILDEKEIFTHGGNVSGGWLEDNDFFEALKAWKIENNNATN